MKKIRVMIIDDSALVRQSLTTILNSDPGLEVIGSAADPIFAAKKITKTPPDVITLDLEMPRMNGLTFLKKLMTQFPLPVVIISSLTSAGTELTLKALEYGAVEVIAKPKLSTKEFFEESKIRICDAVKGAAQATVRKKTAIPAEPRISPKLSADKVLTLSQKAVKIKETTDKIIAIGASTGGTNAIQTFLESMPPDSPGIVIVQHMPELFTKSFAERLDKICSITVREGMNGEMITKGKALIAPGNRHLLIKRTGAKYHIEIVDAPLVNRHRPSVDVLFRSAAKFAGKNAIGIIMTGMGDDGAKGLLEMRNAGAYTIAQDEKSCVVFGMPRTAIELDAAATVMPLDKIAGHVYNKLKMSN
ncbi:MAG: chemotaxis response regulator protein-glutamate methylesterase, partial [Bacteroidales bacterium]|jgi:two-component system chemotaxis response regulator CheB